MWLTSYLGGNCVTQGVCACGATTSAYGHTIGGAQYSDAAHPHAYFKYCADCGDRVYIGGNAVKNHGDGTWGSGTCPDCGTHTFVGQSCTADGVCACGDTISKLGHTLEGVTYSLAAHPHPYFEYCTRCWTKVYTSGNATKNHGDGTPGSGTCTQCGDHIYAPGASGFVHPHESTNICACGDSKVSYGLFTSCSICTAGSQTVSNTVSKSFSTKDWVENNIHFVPTYYVLTGVVEYTNTYIYPDQSLTNSYTYPDFSSFASAVISSATIDNVIEAPTAFAKSHNTVEYYSASGELIATQHLSVVYDDNTGYVNSAPFTLTQKPAYAIASAGFGVDTPVFFSEETVITVITYFQ